jgi:hypothetical protein
MESFSDLESLFEQTQGRPANALAERYQYNTSIKHGQDFLLNHVSSKIPLIVPYVDDVSSTDMSMTLPPDKLLFLALGQRKYQALRVNTSRSVW